jgi:hypothetical protein
MEHEEKGRALTLIALALCLLLAIPALGWFLSTVRLSLSMEAREEALRQYFESKRISDDCFDVEGTQHCFVDSYEVKCNQKDRWCLVMGRVSGSGLSIKFRVEDESSIEYVSFWTYE